MSLNDPGWGAAVADAPEPHERPDSISAPVVAAAADLRLRLWTLDARVADARLLTDHGRLREVLHEAAAAGGATVVGERFCVFGNGAVTGVLVLAQSHLSIHTWPERSLASVDLLSCGDLDGEEILRTVERGLGAERSNVCRLVRLPP